MRLTKTIDLLEQDLKDPGSVDFVDREEAQQLGIEAVKEVICLRSTDRTQVRSLLPGETPEYATLQSLGYDPDL